MSVLRTTRTALAPVESDAAVPGVGTESGL